jgi:hypothetical protein
VDTKDYFDKDFYLTEKDKQLGNRKISLMAQDLSLKLKDSMI